MNGHYIRSLIELGIVQPGDRVYAEESTAFPWGWGVVELIDHGSGTTLWFDDAHVYARWEHDPRNERNRSAVFGAGMYRITKWEINPERTK